MSEVDEGDNHSRRRSGPADVQRITFALDGAFDADGIGTARARGIDDAATNPRSVG